MANISISSVPPKRLAASLNASSTGFQLNNILGWNGSALTSADFGTKSYGAFFNPSRTVMELFEFDPTTIAAGTITLTLRGLKFDGTLATEVAANKLTWIKDQTIVLLGTDAPQVLKSLVDIYDAQTIAGVKTFTDIPLLPASVPTDPQHAANKAYVDSVVSGTAVFDQNIITGTAGESITDGNLVYFKESDQRWYKSDADAVATSTNVKIGFAQDTRTVGQSLNVLIGGLEKGQSGLTAGAKYYLSSTTGGIVTLASAVVARTRFIGWAVSATTLIMANNDLDMNLIGGLAGETLTTGQWVYFKTSDQSWYLTDSDAAATAAGVMIGVCQFDAALGAGTLIRTEGFDRTQSGLTPGSKYYLGGTAGAISTTPGTFPRYVGTALGASRIRLASSNIFDVDQFGQQVYAATSTGNDTYVVALNPTVPALFNGLRLFIKLDVGNTGPATLNVDTLGAFALVKGVSTALVTGDYAANQIIEVVYNSTGTVWQVVTPSNALTGAGTITDQHFHGQAAVVATRDLSTASGNQTIAHGLGVTPKWVRITARTMLGSNGSVNGFSDGRYNGSTTATVYSYDHNGASASSGTDTTNIVRILDTAALTEQLATATMDATNVTLAWTKAGSASGNCYMLVEVGV